MSATAPRKLLATLTLLLCAERALSGPFAIPVPIAPLPYQVHEEFAGPYGKALKVLKDLNFVNFWTFSFLKWNQWGGSGIPCG